MNLLHLRLTLPFAALCLLVATPVLAQTDDFKLEPGYVSLIQGKDLTGWGYKTNNFDGKTESIDGRYTAKDGMIVVNPGKGLAQLWTTRKFSNDFHLMLEFRAAVNADSGVFLRGPQLQCRDYPVAGWAGDLLAPGLHRLGDRDFWLVDEPTPRLPSELLRSPVRSRMARRRPRRLRPTATNSRNRNKLRTRNWLAQLGPSNRRPRH